MTVTHLGAPEPRSLRQLNIASAGMSIVALVCAMAGLVYGSGKLFYGSGQIPQPQQILYVFAFFLLSTPYFFYREAFVEEPELSAFEKSNNTFFAFAIAGFLAVIVMLLLALEGVRASDALHLTILMGISLFPFGYLGARSYGQLKKGGEAARTERLFKNKVLLPAFATCLVSFSFGWSVTNPEWAYICVAPPVLLIIVLKEMAVRIRQLQVSILVSILVLFLIASLLLYRVGGYPFAQVLIIGTTLTFAMGVAEVCKRVVKFHRRIAQNAVETYDFYNAGSNWSSIVFPLLVCFLPLLIDDLPVSPIFGLLSIQYLHWNHWTKQRVSGFLIFFNLVLGLLLPMFVCFQYLLPVGAVGFGAELFDRLFGFTAAAMGCILGVAAFFGRDVGRFLRSAMVLRLDAYSDYENCFFLFLFVALCTLMGVYFYGTLAVPLFAQPLIGAKATETNVYLLVLLISSIGMYWYNNLDAIRARFNTITGSEAQDNSDQDGEQRMNLRPWKSVLILATHVGRFPVACIAAIPVTLVILFHTDMTLPLAIIHAVPICCITMAGFALNDLYDLEKDQAAGRDKLLAVGIVSLRQVQVFAWSLASFGVLSAVLVMHANSVYIIVATLAGVSGYSWLAQKIPVLKGLATAILCCSPFAYAAEVADINIPIIYFMFLIVFISGRELLLDTKDFWGDQRAGINTLVAYLSPSASRILGWLLMIGSLALVTIQVDGIAQKFFLATLSSLAICLLIYVRNERLGLAWSRMTLLCGVLSTAVSL